jgi:hypothetical protein
MQLVVDLFTGDVRLRDGDDLERFSVRVLPGGPGDGLKSGALGALAAALSMQGAGTVEPGGDVIVPPGAVRRLAGKAAASEGHGVGDQWEGGFARMLEDASTRGWTTDDGSIRAHVEWGG